MPAAGQYTRCTEDISYADSHVSVAPGARRHRRGRPGWADDMCAALATETAPSQVWLPPEPRARLVLGDAGSERGPYDGAWWPRSRRLLEELPGLIAELNARPGAVAQVLFSLVFWDATARELTAGGCTVQLRGFRTIDPRLLRVTGSHGAGRLDVLVLPPETDPSVAARAMARAVGDPSTPAAQTPERVGTDGP